MSLLVDRVDVKADLRSQEFLSKNSTKYHSITINE